MKNPFEKPTNSGGTFISGQPSSAAIVEPTLSLAEQLDASHTASDVTVKPTLSLVGQLDTTYTTCYDDTDDSNVRSSTIKLNNKDSEYISLVEYMKTYMHDEIKYDMFKSALTEALSEASGNTDGKLNKSINILYNSIRKE